MTVKPLALNAGRMLLGETSGGCPAVICTLGAWSPVLIKTAPVMDLMMFMPTGVYVPCGQVLLQVCATQVSVEDGQNRSPGYSPQSALEKIGLRVAICSTFGNRPKKRLGFETKQRSN